MSANKQLTQFFAVIDDDLNIVCENDSVTYFPAPSCHVKCCRRGEMRQRAMKTLVQSSRRWRSCVHLATCRRTLCFQSSISSSSILYFLFRTHHYLQGRKPGQASAEFLLPFASLPYVCNVGGPSKYSHMKTVFKKFKNSRGPSEFNTLHKPCSPTHLEE